MTKQADPNSKRSKRRANRNFIGSRPNRRAQKRLARNQGNYHNMGGKTPGEKGHLLHLSGSQQHW